MESPETPGDTETACRSSTRSQGLDLFHRFRYRRSLPRFADRAVDTLPRLIGFTVDIARRAQLQVYYLRQDDRVLLPSAINALGTTLVIELP
jgi:hypothetical protein